MPEIGKKGRSHKMGRNQRSPGHKAYLSEKRWMRNARRKEARRLHRMSGTPREIRRVPLHERWIAAHQPVVIVLP